MSRSRAPTFFSSGVIPGIKRGEVDEEPNQNASDECTEGRPQAAQGDRGKDQQQALRSQKREDLLGEPLKDPAQSGERCADHPDDQNHPLHVDAARCSESGVVRNRPRGLAQPRLEQGQPGQGQHDGGDDH